MPVVDEPVLPDEETERRQALAVRELRRRVDRRRREVDGLLDRIARVVRE